MSADAWVMGAFAVMALAVVAVAVAIGRGRIDVGFESRPYPVLLDDRADDGAGESPSTSENPGPRAP